jgi:hypothetical protein
MRNSLVLAVFVLATDVVVSRPTWTYATPLQSRVAASSYSPPLPIGAPIPAAVLKSQHLVFKEKSPRKGMIGAFQAIRVAMKLVSAYDASTSNAYIVSTRFGKVERTRSPITSYDNRLVWFVVIAGLTPPTSDASSVQSMDLFEMIDGRSGQPLVSFWAASHSQY